MVVAIRKINKKVLWDPTPAPNEKLPDGELRADALAELKTTENKLSVFIVDGIAPERLLTALGCAGRDNVGAVDYIEFDYDVINALGLQILDAPGETPDTAVNLCHRDLAQLTASKLAEFANRLFRDGVKKRLVDKEVGKLVNIGIKNGNIDSAQIKETFLKDLQRERYKP